MSQPSNASSSVAQLVMGANDRPVTPEATRDVSVGLPDAEPVIIAGVGHMPNPEQPSEFARVIPAAAGD